MQGVLLVWVFFAPFEIQVFGMLTKWALTEDYWELLHLHNKEIIIQGYSKWKWLWWSRGSVLAFSTQVCGFKPSWSHRIFKGEKILSTSSFGGEEKLLVPDFRLVKDPWMVWKSSLQQNYWTTFSPIVTPFAARISRIIVDVAAPSGKSGNV
jgi:hypothetical protein